ADHCAPSLRQRLQVFRDGLRLSLEHRHHHSPTFPETEAISFAGSKPTPRLNTVSTLRTSAIVFDGSPSMTTRSACLPAAIDPTRASRPRYVAPLSVEMRIASSGGETGQAER